MTSPASSEDEDNFPAQKPAHSTPKPAPLSPPKVATGPPCQRTRQMEKDFAQTHYKRLLEAEALEKKKKKEVAKEQEHTTQVWLQRMKEAEKQDQKKRKEVKKETQK